MKKAVINVEKCKSLSREYNEHNRKSINWQNSLSIINTFIPFTDGTNYIV